MVPPYPTYRSQGPVVALPDRTSIACPYLADHRFIEKTMRRKGRFEIIVI